MSQSSSKHTPQPVSSKTTYALGALALVVVAAIVFAVYQWNRGSDSPRNDGYGAVRDAAVSVALDSDGAIVLGKPGVAKTVEIFEDPLCPACGHLEKIFGQEIAQQIDEGKFAVRYRLVNFLDSASRSKDYSTRAIAANECVAQAGDGPLYSRFHEALFTTRQPEERGADHDNQTLATIAKDAGASDEVVRCISTGQRVDTARNHAEAALKALEAELGGKAATPSVFLDDKKVDWQNDDWVVNAAG
ncbi:DsbA family protein [Nocardia sp. 2]|uniref:DsbA family protein n=1 Tax=Nocardia acididurans TaxID=2802282 RepID=A0ABS1M3N2_9NOCA|nr:thioredoxin domain-containing protein [Nocardia acididurans]MBL1074785.1 DsbA family protein [Nocardia acididurans]